MQSSEQANKVTRPAESMARHTLASGQRFNIMNNSEGQEMLTGFSAHTTLANLTYRPTQGTSGAQGPLLAISADSSWPSNQPTVRGNMQLSVPGHTLLQPHLCYGYMPAYHSFMNGPYSDYVSFGE